MSFLKNSINIFFIVLIFADSPGVEKKFIGNWASIENDKNYSNNEKKRVPCPDFIQIEKSYNGLFTLFIFEGSDRGSLPYVSISCMQNSCKAYYKKMLVMEFEVMTISTIKILKIIVLSDYTAPLKPWAITGGSCFMQKDNITDFDSLKNPQFNDSMLH